MCIGPQYISALRLRVQLRSALPGRRTLLVVVRNMSAPPKLAIWLAEATDQPERNDMPTNPLSVMLTERAGSCKGVPMQNACYQQTLAETSRRLPFKCLMINAEGQQTKDMARRWET